MRLSVAHSTAHCMSEDMYVDMSLVLQKPPEAFHLFPTNPCSSADSAAAFLSKADQSHSWTGASHILLCHTLGKVSVPILDFRAFSKITSAQQYVRICGPIVAIDFRPYILVRTESKVCCTNLWGILRFYPVQSCGSRIIRDFQKWMTLQSCLPSFVAALTWTPAAILRIKPLPWSVRCFNIYLQLVLPAGHVKPEWQLRRRIAC